MVVAGSELRDRSAHGMSLVGLLVMVVILGTLGAGVVLGLSSMTGPNSDGTASRILKTPAAASFGSGSAGIGALDASSARVCRANADAALSAATLYFTNGGGRSYPTTWSDLTASAPPLFSLPPNVVINGTNPKELDAPKWKLIISGGGPKPPAFACS
jgi:hypothetical protein